MSRQVRNVKIKQRAHEEISFRGRKLERGDFYRFLALILLFAAIVAATILFWPHIKDLFTPGGVERLVSSVQEAGPWGVCVLLGMQLLQVVVAFIPGEVVQLAAGLMYGPWLGGLIIIVGACISSAIVYALVHRLGAPFVQKMVSPKYLDKISKFEDSNKFEIMVFILFLIPGLPKDVFTYLVPLTRMRLRPFLILTTTARTPGILASTFAAAGFADGNVLMSVVILVVVGGIALLGIVFQDRIIGFVDNVLKLHRGGKDGGVR